MSIRAQHSRTSLLPDFLSRVHWIDKKAHTASPDARQDLPSPTRTIANYFQVSNSAANVLQPTVNFSGGAVVSEKIPCNLISESRKRSRECEEHAFNPAINDEFHGSSSSILVTHPAPIPNGLRFSLDDFRQSSSNASTSGPETAGSSIMSIVYEELQSHMSKQTAEIEQLINIRGERMRLLLEEKRQKHDRAWVSIIGESYAKRLRWRDNQLEEARRRNRELKEEAKQASMELQLWQELAKEKEQAARSLSKSLEEMAAMSREGWGESHGSDLCLQEEETITQLKKNRELKQQRTCRICNTHNLSMLLLPCRHLCLCKTCEGLQDACPLCGTKKSASVHVSMF